MSHTLGHSMGSNTYDDVRVQVQPIVGTIPIGTLTDDDVQVKVQPTVGTIQIGNLQLPVRDRWKEIPWCTQNGNHKCIAYLTHAWYTLDGSHKWRGSSKAVVQAHDMVVLPIAL